jgi:hypothetical protein
LLHRKPSLPAVHCRPVPVHQSVIAAAFAGQQRWPSSPQPSHVAMTPPSTQLVLWAEHQRAPSALAQQRWPRLPQAPHEPLLPLHDVLSFAPAQTAPSATQV